MITAKEAYDKVIDYRSEQIANVYSKVETAINSGAASGKTETLYFFKPEELLIKDEMLNYLRTLGYSVEYRESTQRDPAEVCISWKEV